VLLGSTLLVIAVLLWHTVSALMTNKKSSAQLEESADNNRLITMQ